MGHRHFTGYFLPRLTHPHAQKYTFSLLPQRIQIHKFRYTCKTKLAGSWVIPTENSIYRTNAMFREAFIASLCPGDELGVERHKVLLRAQSTANWLASCTLDSVSRSYVCEGGSTAPCSIPPPPPPVLPPPLVSVVALPPLLATTTTQSSLPPP